MNRRDAQMLGKLKAISSSHGVDAKIVSEGHFQIQGPLLVNYWPFSAKRTAYVDGTVKSYRDISMKGAVLMAMRPPELVSGIRRKKYRPEKLKMLKKHPYCYWCKCHLIDETATVDHVIPLSRGGLDNANNRVLACQPCNCERGNSMPEVTAV